MAMGRRKGKDKGKAPARDGGIEYEDGKVCGLWVRLLAGWMGLQGCWVLPLGFLDVYRACPVLTSHPPQTLLVKPLLTLACPALPSLPAPPPPLQPDKRKKKGVKLVLGAPSIAEQRRQALEQQGMAGDEEAEGGLARRLQVRME